MKQIGLVTLLAVLSLAACAVRNPMKPASHPTETEVDHTLNSTAAMQQLADAMKLVADQNWPQAAVALRTLIDARTFRRLPGDVQIHTLRTAEQLALEHGQLKGNYDYFVQSTALPQAGIVDWEHRLVAADRLHNKAELVSCLTVLVQRWPDRAAKFSSASILGTVRQANHLSHYAALPLLQALYDAHWKLKGDIEPSSVWRDLTLLLLDKGRLEEATAVSGHVTDVYVLIAMRSDRRFDSVVAAIPAQFDIDAAAAREFRDLQHASEKEPQSLELKSNVIEALLARQHYEAAVAAADAILLDIRSTNFPSKLYEEYDQHSPWFFNLRSMALQRVDRWDEAVAQLEAASLLNDRHEGNVDQLINLGFLYCDLGRPKDALAALGRILVRANAHEVMGIEAIRLDAAEQVGDVKEAARSLEYLRAHRVDAPFFYESALISVNQLDQAAHELIARLRDGGRRQEALLSLQTYATIPETLRERNMDAKWQAVIARKDVQATIQKVGRLESYRLEKRLYID
jgi:tetratricopeptide (TPR) repeat protein